MAKSYTAELSAWVESRKKRNRQDAAAVAFLAIKGDIVDAIRAGYAVVTIYEHLHETGKIRCSYETFRKHVKRHIKSAPPPDRFQTDPAVKKSEARGLKAETASRPASRKSNPSAIDGFTFDAKPKKEDLF